MTKATPRRLTQKQEAFCLAYLELGNASTAYCKAYSAGKMKAEGIRVNASKLLASTNIALRITELREKAAGVAILVAADVLSEIKKLAFSDIRGIANADGSIKMPHELDPVTAASVASFERDERGAIKYRFWDKNAALEKASKHLGLYGLDNTQKVDKDALTPERLSEFYAQQMVQFDKMVTMVAGRKDRIKELSGKK
jgi:phage terminase small subunit